MPWPNEFGVCARVSMSREAKKTDQQIDLFAENIPVFVICFGVSNKVFITSPSAWPVSPELGAFSRLAPHTLVAVDSVAVDSPKLRASAEYCFWIPRTVHAARDGRQVNLRGDPA